ncbi:MAG: hypothetical protein AB7F59_07220 [Bdellovibrionales bacterium]
MKVILSVLLIMASFSAQAAEISSSQITISPASVDKTIRLIDQQSPGSSHKKISIIVRDSGMSTDVSPRYTVYLGFASMAEMGNVTANFQVTDKAFHFLSATTRSTSIFTVKTVEYRDDGMYEITQTIDATKMLADEQTLRTNCGEDFCDKELSTAISVTETAKKIPTR